jgi:hypothetical protein
MKNFLSLVFSLIILFVSFSRPGSQFFAYGNGEFLEGNKIIFLDTVKNLEKTKPFPIEANREITVETSSGINAPGNGMQKSSIAYMQNEESYYAFMPDYNDRFIINKQDPLADINKYSAGFTRREQVTNLVLRVDILDIVTDNNKVYYNTWNELFCLENGAENFVLKAEIERYYVLNDSLYYKNKRSGEIWKKSLLSTDEPLCIVKGAVYFQLLNDTVYYLTEDGFYRYKNNMSEKIYDNMYEIKDFIADGFLAYTDINGTLYWSGEKIEIAKNVQTYNIYKNTVYYSTDGGLFAYDTLNKESKLLIKTGEREDTYSVRGILFCNENLFLDICENSLFEPKYVLCSAQPDGSSLKPISGIKNAEFQTYFYEDSVKLPLARYFEIDYPVGWFIDCDPARSYGNCVRISEPAKGIFVYFGFSDSYWADKKDFGKPKNAQEEGEKIDFTTKQGRKGYYTVYSLEQKFSMLNEPGFWVSFELEDFFIEVRGNTESFEEIMPILLKMAKSVYLSEISEKTIAERSVPPLSDTERGQIRIRLLSELNYHLRNIGEERAWQLKVYEKETGKNFAVNPHSNVPFRESNNKEHYFKALFYSEMATDKIRGFQGIFDAYGGLKNLLIPNRDEPIIKGWPHSRIFSGYTKSGIHVIAIAPFTTPESFDYATAVNIVRGEEDEAGLLTEYSRDYLWDIYIEDLANKRKKFFVDYYDDGKTIPFPDMGEHPAIKKYNRLSTDNSVLNDRCWYLFKGDSEGLALKVNGETVSLYNFDTYLA